MYGGFNYFSMSGRGEPYPPYNREYKEGCAKAKKRKRAKIAKKSRQTNRKR
jgi:hypothetical protein